MAASQGGFTLVELMVVVAIIALLAAIIIPNYVHSRASAAVAQSEANMKQIATALELYYTDNQQYPQNSADVSPALFAAGDATTKSTTTGGNPYLNATPVNALQRKPYAYAFVGGAGNTTETYTLEDAGPYDPSTMTSIPAAPGVGGQCTACTQLWYSPQAGIYGK